MEIPRKCVNMILLIKMTVYLLISHFLILEIGIKWFIHSKLTYEKAFLINPLNRFVDIVSHIHGHPLPPLIQAVSRLGYPQMPSTMMTEKYQHLFWCWFFQLLHILMLRPVRSSHCILQAS